MASSPRLLARVVFPDRRTPLSQTTGASAHASSIRLRQNGSAAGHKGISSIITELGSQDFSRLRVGIGRPANAEVSEADIIAYVLSDFTPEEKQNITQLIPRVNQAILCVLTEGLAAAMNKYNPRW